MQVIEQVERKFRINKHIQIKVFSEKKSKAFFNYSQTFLIESDLETIRKVFYIETQNNRNIKLIDVSNEAVNRIKMAL
jgi:hypothetical protein